MRRYLITETTLTMEDFIITRGVKNKKKALDNFLSVTFKAPKRKMKFVNHTPITNVKDISNDNRSQIDPKRRQEVEMKRTRFEVMKFAMSGFTKTKAREAKIALAVNLGAKPPRNKKKNYKQILEEKRMEKLNENNKKSYSGVTESLKKQKSRRNPKKNSGILGVYGKVQYN